MIKKVIEGKTHWFSDKNVRLISFNGAVAEMAKNGVFVENKGILNKYAKIGNDFNDYLMRKLAKMEYVYNSKLENMVFGLWSWKEKNKIKFLTLEKHINNNYFHGFIDIDCEGCFLEIKTRSHLNLEFKTVLQCEFYKMICGKDYHILHINRENGVCVELAPSAKQVELAQKFVKNIVENYKIFLEN